MMTRSAAHPDQDGTGGGRSIAASAAPARPACGSVAQECYQVAARDSWNGRDQRKDIAVYASGLSRCVNRRCSRFSHESHCGLNGVRIDSVAQPCPRYRAVTSVWHRSKPVERRNPLQIHVISELLLVQGSRRRTLEILYHGTNQRKKGRGPAQEVLSKRREGQAAHNGRSHRTQKRGSTNNDGSNA